ncbi:MAG: biotin transporter BioY [Propionibacterium sp.]|nr:MAG: biotin transporter BioY [Propionibacterium sp.]
MKQKLGTNIALIAVFAALIAVSTLIPPLFAVGGVPFTFQVIPVLLAPMVLGPWQGTLANALYVFAGLAGLPIFAKQSSGIAVLLGPTGGYIVGFIVSAAVVGLLASLALKYRATGAVAVGAMTVAGIVGVLVIHLAGVIGFMVNLGLGFSKGVLATLPFLPLGLLKAVVAAIIALAVIKAFPRLLGLRR